MSLKVGQTSTDGTLAGKRDAFHIPGCLVFANEFIQPCDNLRFVDIATGLVRPCARESREGVADPFLDGPVFPGNLFWVFVDPSLTDDLSHTFTIQSRESADDEGERADDDDGDDWCRTQGCG